MARLSRYEFGGSEAAVDASNKLAAAIGPSSIFDPVARESLDKWLVFAADAAAASGYSDISIQQQSSESIGEVIGRIGQTVSEGSCATR